MMITRGCGKRVKGGLYACCGLSPYGKPIEDFLIDPPIPYNGKPFRAPMIEEKDDVKHLVFWVGREHYPYCPDFIEETRSFGISKRVPLGFDFTGIEPFKSRMYFIHPMAIIEDGKVKVDTCPKDKIEHIEGSEFCIRSLYYYVDAGLENSVYVRRVGSTRYTVPRLESGCEPTYRPGVFMWTPFSHLEYVTPESGTVDERVKAVADKTNLSVLVVDE